MILALDSKEWSVREASARALGRFGKDAAAAISRLAALKHDSVKYVCDTASSSLTAIEAASGTGHGQPKSGGRACEASHVSISQRPCIASFAAGVDGLQENFAEFLTEVSPIRWGRQHTRASPYERRCAAQAPRGSGGAASGRTAAGAG